MLITDYLGADEPPLRYVTSVRCVVLRGGAVLAQRDRSGIHILPGGRREMGETLEQTLHREVVEETGWRIGPETPLGLRHFRHLSPRPTDYPYPYPEFVQRVYAALAVEYFPQGRLEDGWEMESKFVEIPDVPGLALHAGELAFLAAARLMMQGATDIR